jgi:rhodanese-related sulfurtransferase
MGEELEQVTVDEAIARDQNASILLDVREAWEWQAGHAPSAMHIPLGELADRLDELPVDETVFVICQSGGRSLTATAFLHGSGRAAVNVIGGMTAWERAGGPVARQ